MAAKPRVDPEASSDKPNYEELRRKRIEENRKRLEHLGLLEQAGIFKRSFVKTFTPRKLVKKSAFNREELVVEIRRSPRVARKPSINYNESLLLQKNAADVEEGPRRRKGIGRVLKRGFIPPVARTKAALKAREVKTEHPSFVKAMLKSHVSGGFWLGLPSAFCEMNFSKDDLVILEDEDGLEWEAIYLHHKNGLSGGWRGFSIDHHLEDGDALVFELVKPTRFKVYITRAADCKKHDLDLEVATPKKSHRYALKVDKENEHVNSALHKVLKREQLRAAQNVSTRSVETPKRSRKRKLDLSEPSIREHSGGQQRAHHESAVVKISNSDGGCHADTTSTESRQAKSGRRIPRNGGPATEEVVKSATYKETKSRKNVSQPPIKHKTEQSSGYCQKRKGLERNPTRVVGKDKGVVLTKKVRVTKVVEYKSNSQEAKKSTPHLLRGTKIKAVGVCSIARNGSSARKLPGSRSYNFFSPGEK